MATSKTAKTANTPPMQSFARLIAKPGRFHETTFDLPSGAIRVGDPLTSHAGRVEIGVASASIFMVDVGFGEDNAAIAIRVRPSVAVRWELGKSGGVDSGVFGVWDGDAAMTTDARTPGDTLVGACWIGGRQVFALETGDGGICCVVGFDEKGEVCAVVAGPGVDPVRFGAVLREEYMTEAERAERAAKELRNASLKMTDFLAARLGEERVSESMRWFVAGWLDGLPEAERVAMCAQLETVLDGLALPQSAKKAKERAKADTAAILAWALSCWATVLSATLPDQAARLAVSVSIEKKQMAWVDTLSRVFDYKMTDHRFDLTRNYETQFSREEWETWSHAGEGREPAMTTALRDAPKDLASRFGLTGLIVMVEKTKPHDALEKAFWYASRGLQTSLELYVLATRATDLARVDNGAPEADTPLRPRDPKYVEDMLAKLETPLQLLSRLAARSSCSSACSAET